MWVSVPEPKGGVLEVGAPGRRRFVGLLLVAGMVAVPSVSLVNVDDSVPGARVDAAAGRSGLDLSRPVARDVSRSRFELAGAAVEMVPTTETTVVTTTSAPPTTVAPPTTAARVVAASSAPTTAKPTTTTAKPTTTTAPTTTTTAAPTNAEEGEASFYNPSDPAECAHRTLAFGTIVTVTNLDNGNQTTCQVGDRGPFVEGRIIDLSEERFTEIAPRSQGVARVRIEW